MTRPLKTKSACAIILSIPLVCLADGWLIGRPVIGSMSVVWAYAANGCNRILERKSTNSNSTSAKPLIFALAGSVFMDDENVTPNAAVTSGNFRQNYSKLNSVDSVYFAHSAKIISQTAIPQPMLNSCRRPFANFACKSRGGCRRNEVKCGQVSHRI